MIGLSLQKEQISHVANKNRIATALLFKSRNSVNILSKKSASWGTISQLLVLIHVRWHPTLVMLEERWWGSVFWSFIYFLQISRYPRCIRSISAFCRWNNMVDDEIAVPWAREECPRQNTTGKHVYNAFSFS